MSMRVVSFKASEELIRRIDELVERGYFVNRSEAIRHAIKLLLEKARNGEFERRKTVVSLGFLERS